MVALWRTSVGEITADQRRSCSTDRLLGHSSQHVAEHVLGVAGGWAGGRLVVGRRWPAVLAGGCAGTAVPVLVWGMVPAKHVQQEEWMLRVWGEHRGREVVVWCSGRQVVGLSSAVRSTLVAVV